MRKIVEYIVHSYGHQFADNSFNKCKEINVLIRKGYQPFGSPTFILSPMYGWIGFQPMVKYEEEAKKQKEEI